MEQTNKNGPFQGIWHTFDIYNVVADLPWPKMNGPIGDA